jgi:hypothetical protein
MDDDQFLKLFRAIEAVKSDVLEVKQAMAEMATKDELYRRFDDITAHFDTDTTERAALEAIISRHDGWIRQLEDVTDTKLAADA